MLTEKELFTGSGWESFHDILIEIYKFDYTIEHALMIFNKLPTEIKDVAHCWGLSDTPFKDDAYVYLRNNSHIIKEIINAKD